MYYLNLIKSLEFYPIECFIQISNPKLIKIIEENFDFTTFNQNSLNLGLEIININVYLFDLLTLTCNIQSLLMEEDIKNTDSILNHQCKTLLNLLIANYDELKNSPAKKTINMTFIYLEDN